MDIITKLNETIYKGTNSFTIDISCNVGIGITNPNGKLYISTNAGNNVNSFALRVSSGGETDGSGYAT